MARSFHPCHNHFEENLCRFFCKTVRWNRTARDWGAQTPTRCRRTKNSFLADEANLALSKFQGVLIKKISFLFCCLQKSFRKNLSARKTSIKSFLLLFCRRAIDLCDYLSIIKIEMCESNLASNIEMCVSLRRDPAEKCGGALCYIEKSNRLLRAI